MGALNSSLVNKPLVEIFHHRDWLCIHPQNQLGDDRLIILQQSLNNLKSFHYFSGKQLF